MSPYSIRCMLVIDNEPIKQMLKIIYLRVLHIGYSRALREVQEQVINVTEL